MDSTENRNVEVVQDESKEDSKEGNLGDLERNQYSPPFLRAGLFCLPPI